MNPPLLETTEDTQSGVLSQEHASGYRQQLDRVIQSACFRDTPSSRRLLQYIGTRSLDGDLQNLKEFTIGVEVLGRRANFDPKTDTIVRVQVRRLRQKISDYYETEGLRDPVVITIPKGSYAAEFSLRDLGSDEHAPFSGVEGALESHFPSKSTPPIANLQLADASTNPKALGTPLWPVALLIGIVLIMVGAAGGFFWARRTHPQPGPGSNPVDQLWMAMLKGDDSPIIAYPDAVFLLDGTSDMFQFTEGPVGTRGELVDPNIARKFSLNPTLIASAGPLYYESGGYTGTGEIESIAMLSVLLNKLGLRPKIMRSHEITVDELRAHNVILLGGSGQNKAVKDFTIPSDFDYDYTPRAWGGKIINRNPRPGEAHEYLIERNSSTHAIDGGYAIISCLPSLNSTHRIISLGGIDTTGTLGATLFATTPEGAGKLMEHIDRNSQEPDFQAIVHVSLAHGNQVFQNQLITVHPAHK